MRRSAKVAAPLLAATAIAMMTGCRKPEMQRCVDENNKVVDDNFCANLPSANSNPQYPNMGGSGYVPYIPLYHRYYGGWGGYALGTLVGGGSTSPVEGRNYITSHGIRTGTIRGGFGRSMSGGHGGGAGE